MSEPAFPGMEYGPNDYTFYHYGMSLRDYFAAAALQALAVGSVNESCGYVYGKHPDQMASNAYEIADAMLKEGGYK